MVSDSASTINAGDGMSIADGDENILKMVGGPRRRQHDDDDEGSETYDEDDDDVESLASVAVDGATKINAAKAEEDKELPPHACWYGTAYLFQFFFF